MNNRSHYIRGDELGPSGYPIRAGGMAGARISFKTAGIKASSGQAGGIPNDS